MMDIIQRIIAPDSDIEEAKKNGVRHIVKDVDGEVVFYQWQGKFYITEINIIPEAK
jgi:hypothetical protein